MKYTLILIILLPIVNANLIITEVFPNPIDNEKENEYIEIYNNSTYLIELTNYSIKDEKEQDYLGNISIPENSYAIITTKETLLYNNSNIQENITKIFLDDNSIGNGLNNNQETIYLLFNNETISSLSYTKTKENFSWSLYNDEFILTVPTPGYETIYLEIEEIQEEKSDEKIKDSYIKILSIKDIRNEKTTFGSTIKLRLNIYRGNTNKKTIEYYIEEASKIYSFNIDEKYTNLTLELPLQIVPNCDFELENSTYDIIVSGLDQTDKSNITIEGLNKEFCRTKIIESVKECKCNTTEKYLKPPNTEVYISTNEKARRSGVFFFSFVLVITTISLMKEQWNHSKK